VRFAHSPAGVCRLVDELLALPEDEVLAAGADAHRWVSGRLTDFEAARFMIGAADKRYLSVLPQVPWQGLANEWPQ
jgi:hypothetical protein